MSFYGKLAGAITALGIIGGSAAYVASESAETLAYAKEVVYDSAQCFILKEYEGSVALFEEGSEAPIAVYSTPLSQINPADAAILIDGIRLRGMNEVARLLEDLDVE